MESSDSHPPVAKYVFNFNTRVFPKPFGATSAWEDRFRLDRNSSTSVVRSNTELWELLKSLSSVSCCASSTHAGIPTSRKISFYDRRPLPGDWPEQKYNFVEFGHR